MADLYGLLKRLRDRDQSIVSHHESKLGKKLDVPFTLEGMAVVEIERLTAEGRALSDAYVRLRALIPGAFKTPHAPTPEQVWETTENALRALLAERNALYIHQHVGETK